MCHPAENWGIYGVIKFSTKNLKIKINKGSESCPKKFVLRVAKISYGL